MWIKSIIRKHLPLIPRNRTTRDSREAHIVIRFMPSEVLDAVSIELPLHTNESLHVGYADEDDIRHTQVATKRRSHVEDSMIGLDYLVLDREVGADENVDVRFCNLCHDEIVPNLGWCVKKNFASQRWEAPLGIPNLDIPTASALQPPLRLIHVISDIPTIAWLDFWWRFLCNFGASSESLSPACETWLDD